MCGHVVGGWSCDVTDHVGRVRGGAVHSWGVASSRQGPPVGGGGEAGVVRGVMGEMGGVRVSRMRKRGRGRGQVGCRGWSFIWQVHRWVSWHLIWVQEDGGGGGALGGGADGGRALHGGGGA